MWEGIYADIEKVSESHRNREGLAQREAMTDAEILAQHHADNLIGIRMQYEGPGDWTQALPDWWLVGDTTYYDKDKALAAVSKQNQSLLDINSETNKEIINNYRETTRLSGVFCDDMFDGWEEGEEARVEASMSANDAIIQNMEEFASNREELFWGSRENFTGALYKTIQQGQVENLLYKTEIMQTNNFYGITIDDAIDRVSEGVLDMLRVEGVIE